MTQGLPPGWYYAEGDPPGTHRFWDGLSWQGGPQPVAVQAVPTTIYSPVVRIYPEGSQATTALILSILGYVACCLITCPIGWYIANEEARAIRAGRRDPSNMGVANAARILGIVGTIIIGIGIVGYGGLFLFAGLLSL